MQDVFETELSNKYKPIEGISNLSVANFDPVTAADEYMESVVGPYRGVLPDSAVANMEEQLSGSCTVEIAAFNEFANLLTDKKLIPNLTMCYLTQRQQDIHCVCCNYQLLGIII